MNIMNVNIRKNFKIVASIIYASVIDYCSCLIPKLESHKSKDIMDCLEDSREGVKEMSQKKIKINELVKTLSTMTKQGNDTSDDEIGFISCSLFKNSELTGYYNMAKDYNFSLRSKIEEFVEKLVKVLD